MANIVLTDDGTLDTVIECLDCGEQFRFNYSESALGFGFDINESDQDREDAYDEFVEECIAEIEGEHECDVDEENEE